MQANPKRLPGARRALASLGPIALAFGLLLFGVDESVINVYDEGDVLYGAQRVLAGALPYRDFWAIYGPGQYWAVAGWFDLFGTSILVERIWDSLIRAAIVATAFSLARRLSGGPSASVVGSLTLGWLWISRFYGYPLLPAALFGFLAVALLLCPTLQASPRRAAFLAGTLTGIAALFRPDIGAYTLLAAATWMALNGSGRQPPAVPALGAKAHLGRRLAGPALLFAGAGAVGLPALFYFLANVRLRDLSFPLLVYPATIYPETRTLPFPSLLGPLTDLVAGEDPYLALDRLGRALALYFPWLVVALSGARLSALLGSRPPAPHDPARRSTILLLSLVVFFWGIKSTIRPHIPHVSHVLAPAFVLVGVLTTSGTAGRSKLQSSSFVLLLALMAFPPLYSLARLEPGSTLGAQLLRAAAQPGAARSAVNIPGLPAPVESPPAAAHFRLDMDQLAAVAFIRENTTRQQPLFVANGRHDLAFGSDVLFYFLAERVAVTRHHEFNPGVTTTAAVQAEIIRALEAQSVPFVVRTTRFDDLREPNQSAVSSGVSDLDDYLGLNYLPVAKVGRYEISRRREPMR